MVFVAHVFVFSIFWSYVRNVVKDANAYYTIEYAHFNRLEMTLNIESMLQLLSDELQHSTIRNVIKLLVDPVSSCHFVPLFKSCVKVRSFERINSTSLSIYFYHIKPILTEFKLAVCLPKLMGLS